MITTINKDDGKNWCWSDGEKFWCEDGTERTVETTDIIFNAGKYKGSKLSEISDTWYLKFLKDKNPKDHFISLMFGRRLKELE